MQRETVPSEHLCPTAAGLLMLGTWFAASGAAPAAVVERPSGCPWFSSRVKVGRRGGRWQLVSSGSASRR